MSSQIDPVPTNRPDLSIEKIETVLIRVPLERTYWGSHYKMTHRSTVITRIYTASGLVGEAYAADEDENLELIDRVIRHEMAPILIGADAFCVERIWELTRPSTWDILRDRRIGLVAAAAVDGAVWDVVGKALNMPLWKLWGGYREQVPVISIGGYYSADADISREVSDLVSAGFAGMKFKVGGLSPAEDIERVREARRVAGDDFAIAVDANQGYTVLQAIEFAKRAEDLHLLWFEEPCRWDNDRRGMRDVRLAGSIPVCAGQTELHASGCRDLMETGSIDYCNFDSSWSGGATEWRRVAGVAAAYDVKMAHHEEPQVSLHLIASIPHGTYVEFFAAQRDPMWHNLVANRPHPKDGFLRAPTGSGLGWELDEDFIARYRVPSLET